MSCYISCIYISSEIFIYFFTGNVFENHCLRTTKKYPKYIIANIIYNIQGMPLSRKILIAIIILLFSYILYRLLQKRQEVMRENSQKSKEGFNKEGFENAKNSIVAQSINSANTGMPLAQYCVKGSYNTALTGNTISLDMIKYVLSRGCRFVDFEVFYIDDTPYVAYTNDSTYTSIQTENKLLLDEVLTKTVLYAFGPNAPNAKDPLFIHIRVKSTNNNVYKAVGKSVDYALRDKLYEKPVDDKTKLADIMGKVVLIMDKTINYDYGDYSRCGSKDLNCYDLTKFVNIESGSEYVKLFRYNEVLLKQPKQPTVSNDNETVDVKSVQIVLPDFNTKNIKNPNFGEFVMNYGSQIVPFRFYQKDDELANYEKVFSDNSSGIMPMSKTMLYFKKQKEHAESK